MTNRSILKEIRQALKKQIDRNYKKGAEHFFKEKIKVYGVRVPLARKISRNYFSLIKDRPTKEILQLAEELLKSGYSEEATIALDWSYRIRKRYQKTDFKFFERWLKKYVSNWGTCDDFCGHTLGYFISQFPDLVPLVKKWTQSKNRWLRRAAAVIFIPSVSKKKYLNHVFWVADKLLMDKDDLVQKGYGWALKVASNLYQKQVFDFIMKRKHKMPRTALRYAIEKMPLKMRKKAMS